MKNKFDILLIEDNPSDAKLIDVFLSDAYNKNAYSLKVASTLAMGLKCVASQSFDVILLDLSLPDSVGLETFKKVFEAVSHIPIIIISATINEALGLSAMKMGAQDFLLKGVIEGKDLRRSINYSIGRNDLLKELSDKTKKLEEKTSDLVKEKIKLSQAQKLAQLGSWEWDIRNHSLSWSDELYEIYGLERRDFNASPEAFLEAVHVDDREFTKSIISKTFKTLTPFNFYHRIVRPDKEVRMIHAIGKVVKDTGARPIVMLGTAQDVTERVHGEEIERLVIAATKSFNSVVIANRKGEIEWVNDGFTQLSGYVLDEVKRDGSSAFRVFDGTKFKNEKAFSDALTSKIPFSFERECQTKEGKKYWVISTITPMLDKNGEVERIMAIDTDISERKQMEEELVRTNTIKEQFLTNMSHEIRTPMNAIVGFTDLLLKTELSADQRQCIDAVKTSGRNLIVIINDILDFSKIEAGKIVFEQIEFDLRHLISTLTELMLPKSMEKNIRISTKIDKRIHDQLIGDPTRLNQIFLNLVGNAIKFTEKGEVKISAEVVFEDDDSMELSFMVSDTGIGIPDEKIDFVFEGFTQATNETNRKYGGTGLGLTIVKQLVELQGGTIAVKSKLGVGSIFKFNMKFKKGAYQQLSDNMYVDSVQELEHIDKLNILLVEDNLLNQILAKKVLTNWKWNVDVADNGLIAVQKMNSSSYDIVLMDIQMPEMDGYEATRQIRKRKNSAKRNIPIIAITAHAISGEAEKCYKAGMNDYITKPFDEKVLYEKIISICYKQNAVKINQL